MSTPDFDTAFQRFADDMHRDSAQDILANSHFLEMRALDVGKAETVRIIFSQYLPWGPKYMEQRPKSDIFVNLLLRVITQRLTADDFIKEFTERAAAPSVPGI